MKKVKRILALAGAMLLFALYASTLIFAFIDSDVSLTFLRASIACTIILPVLIYAYILGEFFISVLLVLPLFNARTYSI